MSLTKVKKKKNTKLDPWSHRVTPKENDCTFKRILKTHVHKKYIINNLKNLKNKNRMYLFL